MIQRTVTTISGVAIGLIATIAAFGAFRRALDNFYRLTPSACVSVDNEGDPAPADASERA